MDYSFFMAADTAILAVFVAVSACFYMVFHIHKADYLLLCQFFSEASVFIIAKHNKTYKQENAAEYRKYEKAYPQHSHCHFRIGRASEERSEMYGASDCDECQHHIEIKIREKLRRKKSAMRANLHSIGYVVIAVFTFFHWYSPIHRNVLQIIAQKLRITSFAILVEMQCCYMVLYV